MTPNSEMALVNALAEIISLTADLRVERITSDALAAQLKAVKEIAETRQRDIAALREMNVSLVNQHRQFVVELLREQCAGDPDTLVIDNTLYDEYERCVVVSLERLHDVPVSAKPSLMFKQTRVSPRRAGDTP